MTHPTGTILNGIRDLAGLRERCFVDDATGCWHCRGWRDRGAPKVRFVFDGQTIRSQGRRAAWVLSHGRLPAPGVMIFAKRSCESEDCVAPDHVRAGTKSEYMQRASERGAYSDPRRIALLAKNRAGRTLTPLEVLDIATSSETTVALGIRHGISQSQASRVKRGNRSGRNPVPRAAASVFNWNGAA